MAEGTMSQEVILDMFFEILNIEVPDWGQAFMGGRRLTSENESCIYVFCTDELA